MVINHSALKKAIEAVLCDRATVTMQITRTNPITHVEEPFQETLYIDIPCKVSYRNITSTARNNADGFTHFAEKAITLFTHSEVDIPGGSTITVSMASGDVVYLEKTGIPACYPTHKEYSVSQIEDYL